MPVPSISLEDFQQSNQAVLSDGGPWLSAIDPGQHSVETICGSQKWVWCDGVCLVSAVLPPETQSSYPTSFNANISVPMDRYGGATELDFTWNYWPLYCGSQYAAGRNFPMHIQVGTASFDDTLVTVDYKNFFAAGYAWEPSPKFSHSGTTQVTRGSDGTHGYISITISMVMNPVGKSEWINLYIKGIGFQITTPVQNPSPISPPPLPSSTSSTSSQSSSSTATNISAGSQSNTSSVTSSLSEQTVSNPELSAGLSGVVTPAAKVSTGTVLGSVVGAIGLISFLLIGFLIYRRRRRTRASSSRNALDVNPLPFTPLGDSGDDMSKTRLVIAPWARVKSTVFSEATHTQSDPSITTTRIELVTPAKVRCPPLFTPPWTRSHNHIPQEASSSGLSSLPNFLASRGAAPPSHPSSTAESQSETYDPPPNYGGATALFSWSNSNRAVISENLEARLLSAGYLPNDDPDNLTEEEWRQYGVTKLELLRLRRLYARDYLDLQKS